jgi:hypothetical protein
MPTVSGYVSATINGQPVNIFEASWSPNTQKSEGVVCLNGPVGAKTNYVYGEISFKMLDDPLNPVSSYQNLSDATIQIVQANGKSILGSGCFVVETQTVNSDEAQFELKFMSADVSEV